MSLLFILLLLPVLTVTLVLAFKSSASKWVAFAGSSLQLVASFLILGAYLNERSSGNNSRLVFESNYTWFESLNIHFHSGIDGISLSMILLTSLIVLAGTLISWKIETLTKEFYILILLLSLGAYGFFISVDLFSMFFFLELAVIPKFLLIAFWGSGKKEYSAMKLALMLMLGSALVLTASLILYFSSPGTNTFDMVELSQIKIPEKVQLILFPLFFLGFGIFTAIFPFHTWAPDGHSSAPTAASMFLAGISMKLGGYGCLRVATYLLPEAAHYYSPFVIILATIAIVYGSFATLMQQDLKYINAYSSVSHCGFVLLGIGMLSKTALIGSVMQMVSHGVMTALFFGAIGMIYERTHTRQLSDLGGLLKIMPFASVIFMIAGLCSLGLPGLSGFVSEMTIFVGSWFNKDWFSRIATLLACSSIVVTAVYILRAVGKAIMGPIAENCKGLSDAAWYEKFASLILLAGILVIGLYPSWLINLISPDAEIIIQNLLR